MDSRRGFLQSILADLTLVALCSSEECPSTSGTKTIYQQDLPNVSLSGWQVTVLELFFSPGVDSLKHIHPGFVLGYVLNGEFRLHLEGKEETVLRSGNVFYEPPGCIHLPLGSASCTRPARVLALAFAEKGKELVMAV